MKLSTSRHRISIKWRNFSRCVDRVIIGEFGEVENICPVILMIAEEAPQVLLQRLICSFGLAVGLWVVAGGEVTSDLEHFKKVLPEF